MKIDIIGGGIIGMSAAYHLSQHGVDVRVFERDPAYTNASFARSCGGIRAQFLTEANVRLSMFSREFLRQVPAIGFTPNGYLMLFPESMEADFHESNRVQAACGLTPVSVVGADLTERFPWLNTEGVAFGCYTEDGSEGWFDPFSLHTFYRLAAKEAGTTFVAKDATAEDATADHVIIASGCWSASVAAGFGITLPVVPRKHTVYRINCATRIPSMPLVADLTTGAYWRPEGGHYRVVSRSQKGWRGDRFLDRLAATG